MDVIEFKVWMLDHPLDEFCTEKDLTVYLKDGEPKHYEIDGRYVSVLDIKEHNSGFDDKLDRMINKWKYNSEVDVECYD